jgi:hypothetical protein
MSAKVFFLMDAFSSDYLSEEDTPFLFNCANEGEYTKKIINGFGFCERAEIFTGVSSIESNYISAIGYNPERSPYKNLSILLKLISFVDKCIPIPIFQKIIRRLLALLIYRFKHPLNPYQIPYQMLKYFALTEDYNDHSKMHALKHESIFDIALMNSKKIHHNSFTGLNKKNNGTDDNRLDVVLKECSSKYPLYLIYISSMDAYGHKYGPKSIQVKEALKELDGKLKKFVSQFEKKLPQSTYVFLGDHGMTTIKDRVDIKAILYQLEKNIKIQAGKDYIYFLDSTMLRVWILSKNLKGEIENYIESQPILNKKGIFYSDHPEYKPNKELGDIVWCANSGILISPDFFHTGKDNLKGMHGYLNAEEGGTGMCIKYGNVKKKVYEKKDLHCVFDDLVDSVS